MFLVICDDVVENAEVSYKDILLGHEGSTWNVKVQVVEVNQVFVLIILGHIVVIVFLVDSFKA